MYSDRPGREKVISLARLRVGGIPAQTPTHVLYPPSVTLRPGGLQQGHDLADQRASLIQVTQIDLDRRVA